MKKASIARMQFICCKQIYNKYCKPVDTNQ